MDAGLRTRSAARSTPRGSPGPCRCSSKRASTIRSSIDLTADVLMMDPIRSAVRASKEKVLAGKDLSVTLDASRQFSPDVIAIIASGEETGKLPESLAHLADDYEEQVSVMVKNLGQLVQPLLLLFLGGIVLFIILAVFLPYIQMLTSFSGRWRMR